MKNRYIGTITVLLIGLLLNARAQETVPATGGTASGANGSISYTIGQVFYITSTNATGTLTEGVQQPYEILVTTGIEEANGILLECTAFPNPAVTNLTLKIRNYPSEHLTYQLLDLNGKLIQKSEVKNNETVIQMSDLAPAVYLLSINDKSREIKTFRIIKN